MELYQETIIDLAKNPLNRRVIGDATFMHSGVNVTCGDHVRIYLKIFGDEKSHDSKIVDASWEGEGCAISFAAASILTEELKKMTVGQLQSLQNQDMFDFLGIPSIGPARVKCAVLCLETAKGCFEGWTRR